MAGFIHAECCAKAEDEARKEIEKEKKGEVIEFFGGEFQLISSQTSEYLTSGSKYDNLKIQSC